MSVIIALPEKIEQQLTAEWGDLSRRALEALAIEGYREAQLSLGQVAEMLGLGVVQADAFLKERGVALNYTIEDYEQDMKSLETLLKNDRRL